MAADLPPLRSDKPPPPRDRATASYSSVPTTSDPSPSSAVGSPQPLPPAMADPLLTMATPSPPLALRRRSRPPSRDPSLLELLLTPWPPSHSCLQGPHEQPLHSVAAPFYSSSTPLMAAPLPEQPLAPPRCQIRPPTRAPHPLPSIPLYPDPTRKHKPDPFSRPHSLPLGFRSNLPLLPDPTRSTPPRVRSAPFDGRSSFFPSSLSSLPSLKTSNPTR